MLDEMLGTVLKEIHSFSRSQQYRLETTPKCKFVVTLLTFTIYANCNKLHCIYFVDTEEEKEK